jgi:hypothetical protein
VVLEGLLAPGDLGVGGLLVLVVVVAVVVVVVRIAGVVCSFCGEDGLGLRGGGEEGYGAAGGVEERGDALRGRVSGARSGGGAGADLANSSEGLDVPSNVWRVIGHG